MIRADNTDASGLIAALEPDFDPAGAEALVLGAGGSARAVAWALDRAGAAVTIANRTESRAVRLAGELGVFALEGVGAGEAIDIGRFDLLVNATSVGLASAGAPPSPSGGRPKGDAASAPIN